MKLREVRQKLAEELDIKVILSFWKKLYTYVKPTNQKLEVKLIEVLSSNALIIANDIVDIHESASSSRLTYA